MKSANRFYLCRHCGNLVGMIDDKGVPIICCGEPMKKLAEKSGAIEVKVSGCIVNVKAPEAKWIYMETEKGGMRRVFAPGDAAEVNFSAVNDRPTGVYVYAGGSEIAYKEITE